MCLNSIAIATPPQKTTSINSPVTPGFVLHITVNDKTTSIPLDSCQTTISVSIEKLEPSVQSDDKFTQQLEDLNQKGYKNNKRNLKLLQKFNGDQEKVERWIITKQSNNRQDNPNHWQLLRNEYSSQLETLKNKGFKCERRILKALKQSDGNVDQAVQWLQTNNKNQSSNDPASELYAEQLALLNELGFIRPKQNLRVLQRFQGNVELALKFLCEKQSKHQSIERITKGSGNLVTDDDFSAQIAQLNEKGFHNQQQNLRVLKRFQGNLEQTLEFLQKKQSGLPPRLQNAKNLYQNELTSLNQQGFNNEKLNLRVLLKFEGDLDQTIKCLQSHIKA